MRKGVILDGYALNPGDLSWEGLRRIADFEVYDRSTPEEAEERARGKELVITNKVPFDGSLMDRLPDLRYIGVTATGYNIIDIEAARERGIAVTNIPSYSTEAVAQHVFALLLSVTNHVSEYSRSVKEGMWERSRDFCYYLDSLRELKDLTFGVYGLGRIGRQVALIAKAFSMNVISYSPHSAADGIEAVGREELFRRSDIISLHVPLTEDTRKIIGDSTISMMKRGVILINTARGLLVDDEALLSALDDGRIGWYLSDVLSEEPPADSILLKHEHAVFTPHIAWAAKETRQRLLEIAESNASSFVSGGMLNRIV